MDDSTQVVVVGIDGRYTTNTTTQMILDDDTQTLMEVDIKYNRLLKYWAINGGGCIYLPKRSKSNRLLKSINGDDTLRKPPPKIGYL